MKMRIWPNSAARAERIAQRIEQKNRVREAKAQIRQTRERTYQPPTQSQNYGGG